MKPAKEKPSRRCLTVYYKHFPRGFPNYIILPEIRLSGKWLQSMGFKCGKSISVQPGRGRIIITLNKPLARRQSK